MILRFSVSLNTENERFIGYLLTFFFVLTHHILDLLGAIPKIILLLNFETIASSINLELNAHLHCFVNLIYLSSFSILNVLYYFLIIFNICGVLGCRRRNLFL